MEQHYSEQSFWSKLTKFAKKAGVQVVYAALLLFYAMKHPNVPVWAKTTIAGALGYFIFPIDAIPDVIPIAGYTDDLGTLLIALGVVSAYINDDIKRQAREKLAEWFGQGHKNDIHEVERKLIK